MLTKSVNTDPPLRRGRTVNDPRLETIARGYAYADWIGRPLVGDAAAYRLGLRLESGELDPDDRFPPAPDPYLDPDPDPE